jgi:O-antigen/teichoic acid export membrane protein
MSILRASTHTLIAQLVGAASTAFVGVFIARQLGAAGLGVYALALALTMLAAPVADVGVSLAAARALARTTDLAGRGQIYSAAASIKLLMALVSGAAMYAVSAPIASLYGSEGLDGAFRAASVALVGQGLLTFLWSTLIAEGRGALNLAVVLVRVAAETSITVGVILAGHGAAAAILARGIAHVLAASVGFGVLFSDPRNRVVPKIQPIVRLARSSLSLAAVEVSYGALYQVDLVMIGVFMTPAAVGIYQAPLRILAPLTYVGVAVASGLAPAVAREQAGRIRRRLVARAFTALAFAEAGIAAATFGGADALTHLFGPGFATSAHILRLLAPYVFIGGFGPVASLLVTYLGRSRQRLFVAVTALALNVVLDVILIPTAGLTGAATAADIAAVYYVGSHCWLVARTLDLRVTRIAILIGQTASIALGLGALLYACAAGPLGRSPAVSIGGGFAAALLLASAFRFMSPRHMELLTLSGASR